MCKFRIEDRCTFDVCDEFGELVSENLCTKCPYKTQIYDLSEETLESDKLCGNCVNYCLNPNLTFYGQCIFRGVMDEKGTCTRWKKR